MAESIYTYTPHTHRKQPITPELFKLSFNFFERDWSSLKGKNPGEGKSWPTPSANSINANQTHSERLKRGLPCDPAISLLGMYLEKTLIQKDAHTPVSIAELFTIAKSWKQPKCPLIDEWVKKMWCVYIYIMKYIYIFSHKNEWIMSLAATQMDLEINIVSEVSQTKTNIM